MTFEQMEPPLFNGCQSIKRTIKNIERAIIPTTTCSPALKRVSALSDSPTPCYSANHAALLNLTRTTAVNCARARDHIRVNAVICGMSSNSPVKEIMDMAERMIPLGRPAYAEDIAGAILWLASEDSRYVTGASVMLDGGYTAEGYPNA